LAAGVAAGYATAGLVLRPVRAALARERRFVAEASHSLRTPLAVIATEVELAELGPPDPTTQAAALRSIGEETRRMTRLTDQLLLLAAHDEKRLLGPRETVSARALLEGVAARHRGAAGQGRMITVTTSQDLAVTVDRARLEGALDGLVENALRHGAGTVRLSADRVDGRVALRVCDEGGGFATTTLGRFRRGPGSTGAGLGLAIAFAVAEAHGGQATVGPGSEVTLTLA
jgi:signal transduction histidine kinase